MGKYLQRDVLLVVVGTHLDIRNFKAELMRLETMDGCQYVESTLYDMGTSHAVHTMSSCSLLFATPIKFAFYACARPSSPLFPFFDCVCFTVSLLRWYTGCL